MENFGEVDQGALGSWVVEADFDESFELRVIFAEFEDEVFHLLDEGFAGVVFGVVDDFDEVEDEAFAEGGFFHGVEDEPEIVDLADVGQFFVV